MTCVAKLQYLPFEFVTSPSTDSVSEGDSISASLGLDLHRVALASRNATP
jgi:hypothetical protein